MKINEVEQQVGITKKNIRFYEEEGLLTPRRNSENGYRDYGENEVDILRRIKLLRKLGFPLEEIRQIQRGALTIPDGMARHRIALEREQKNLEQSIVLCTQLAQNCHRLEDLDAATILGQMEEMEAGGTTFSNRQKLDRRRSMVAPVFISLGIIGGMIVLLGLVLHELTSTGGIPAIVLPLVLALFGLAALPVFTVLIQRLREIGTGELDEAKQY